MNEYDIARMILQSDTKEEFEQDLEKLLDEERENIDFHYTLENEIEED